MSGYHYRYTRILADLLYQKAYDRMVEWFLRGLAADGGTVVRLGGFAAGLLVSTAILTAAVGRTLLARDHDSTAARVHLNAANKRVARIVSAQHADDRADGGVGRRGRMLRNAVSMPLGHFSSLPPETLRRIGLIGFLLTAILWVDKLIFWIAWGVPVGSSRLVVFPRYDIAVFLSQLFLIPAMVFFAVRFETTLFRGIRDMLRAIRGRTYTDVQHRREELRVGLSRTGVSQVGLALLLVTLSWLLAPDLTPGHGALPPHAGDAVARRGATDGPAAVTTRFCTRPVRHPIAAPPTRRGGENRAY